MSGMHQSWFVFMLDRYADAGVPISVIHRICKTLRKYKPELKCECKAPYQEQLSDFENWDEGESPPALLN